MKYKLIASDFDDTLLPPSGIISDYTQNVIHEYIRRGGIFVLCTGRMYRSIKKQAQKLNLHGDAICYQGALTKNIDSEKVLDSVSISPDLAVEYIHFMQSQGCTAQMYVDDVLTIDKENPYSANYAKFCNITPQVVGDYEKFIRQNNKPISKVFCFVDVDKNEKVRNLAKEKFGDRLLINSSKANNIETVNILTSKGEALRKLAKSYGIDMSDVMTFGDNLNDMPLVECAGFGVAVGNAVEQLKNVAKYVCESVGDDGVAKTIEKFCLRD